MKWYNSQNKSRVKIIVLGEYYYLQSVLTIPYQNANVIKLIYCVSPFQSTIV